MCSQFIDGTKRRSLTPTPPMGWNSFDCYGGLSNEEILLENLEVFAQRYKPVGYTYFVLDGGWFAEFIRNPGERFPSCTEIQELRLDEYGRYIPSKTNFPNGLKKIADRAHELGVKFGLHLMRGIPKKAVERKLPILGTSYTAADIANKNDTCSWCDFNYGIDMNRPGSQEYYDSLIELVASWGVDFIKADDITTHPQEVEAFVRGIAKCERDIVLSLSPGDNLPIENMKVYQLANTVRITHDIWDIGTHIDDAFAAWKQYSDCVAPGFYLDLDIIPFGRLNVYKRHSNSQPTVGEQGDNRWCALNTQQKYTFITMRALAGSPLFIGGELISMDPFSITLLTDSNMVDCNQHCGPAFNVFTGKDVTIWCTSKKGIKGEGYLGVFNCSGENIEIDLDPDQVPMLNDQHRIYDIWKQEYRGNFSGVLPLYIPKDGVAFLKYSLE